MIVNLKSREEKIRAAAILLMIITVAVIWFNSSLSIPVSSAQSEITEKIVEKVVLAEVPFFQYLINHLRKSAHVIEYGVLGIEVFMIFVVGGKKPFPKGIFKNFQRIWNMITLPLFIAVTDESIQILSGRGPAIRDVLFDMSGALGGIFICTIVYFFFRRIRR